MYVCISTLFYIHCICVYSTAVCILPYFNHKLNRSMCITTLPPYMCMCAFTQYLYTYLQYSISTCMCVCVCICSEPVDELLPEQPHTLLVPHIVSRHPEYCRTAAGVWISVIKPRSLRDYMLVVEHIRTCSYTYM